MFIRGRWDRSRVLGVIEFILIRWVHSPVSCMSLGSSACPGGRCIHPGSFGSLASTLGVIVFI